MYCKRHGGLTLQAGTGTAASCSRVSGSIRSKPKEGRNWRQYRRHLTGSAVIQCSCREFDGSALFTVHSGVKTNPFSGSNRSGLRVLFARCDGERQKRVHRKGFEKARSGTIIRMAAVTGKMHGVHTQWSHHGTRLDCTGQDSLLSWSESDCSDSLPPGCCASPCLVSHGVEYPETGRLAS